MHPITSRHELEVLTDQLSTIIDTRRTLPDQLLKDQAWHRGFCSFDLYFPARLLNSCIDIAKEAGDKEFSFVMLTPDAISYFYKHFRRFGAGTFACDEHFDDMWTFFEEDPGGSPADALVYSVCRFAICSPSATWVVYGEREQEVILVGAAREETLRAFPQGDCCLYDADNALRSFLHEADDCADRIRANYGGE